MEDMIECEGVVCYRDADGTEITVEGQATSYEDFVQLFIRASLAAGFGKELIAQYVSHESLE